MKKVLIVIFLTIFSFYYTNKTIDIIRETDPIMKEIKKSNNKYYKKAMNAKVVNNTIIPGINGKKIDYKKSYRKMKKYGNYNEVLTVFKETKPNISINNIYDKYITVGNNEKKSVSLVFKIENNTDIENIKNINNILVNKNIKSTIFIDGLFLENNLDLVNSFKLSELEILNYDNSYKEIYFSSSINYLNNITGKTAKYCYADYDNKELIELCSRLKLHTILPTIKVGNYPYKEIKNKLQNASIISIPTNSSTEIELSTVIDYIKSRGYTFLTLDELLSESYDK
ncbi:MAG: hypothetical protein IKG58_01660 [Bacilli bacterium]|nr:hypothetical protein [Bacilli bacterium]MBR3049252.1 hypothetical protein [Bacilli bacterium]